MAVPFENLYSDRWPDGTMWIVAVQLENGRRVALAGGRPDGPGRGCRAGVVCDPA